MQANATGNSEKIEEQRRLVISYRAEYNQPLAFAHIPSINEKFLQKVKNLIEINIGNPYFGVAQMADEINLSRAQLFRKLKALSGITPHEFINNMRLQRAAKLIQAKADTLAQISYSVGFNGQSYFAKCFKKKFGVLPSEYGLKGEIMVS